jgi:hypothetical protein
MFANYAERNAAQFDKRQEATERKPMETLEGNTDLREMMVWPAFAALRTAVFSQRENWWS